MVEEVANGGRMMLIDELVAGDFREHAGPPGLPSDREVLKQAIASRRLFGSHAEYVISGLESRDDVVILKLLERSSENSGHPHPSPLPSRERGQESHPTPLEFREYSDCQVREHRIRMVEGKIAEHWGVKPLFSTSQP